jgi:coproporphyrinogen III oxidase
MTLNEYFNKVQEEALEGFKKLNDTGKVEQKKWDGPLGNWDIHVVRGKVFEKATVARITIETKHPDTGEDAVFDTLQAKVFPVSPRLPILIFNFEHMAAKENRFLGMLDVAPVIAVEEDLHLLRTGMKRITEKHGENYEALSNQMAHIYKLDQWEKPLNGGIGISLLLPDKQSDLVKEAGFHLLRSYLAIVEKRKQEPYSEEDIALRDSAWTRMLEYYFLGDQSFIVAVQQGAPLEALTLTFLPPAARY